MPGDPIAVMGSSRSSRVKDIVTFDGSLARASAGDSVTLTLEDEIDVSRGDMIVSAAGAPEASRALSATLCWFDERALDRRRTYLLRHTTREVRARIDRLDHLWNVSTQEEEPAPEALAMNDIGQATILLAQPIVADRYDDNHATGSFILIDEATNGTVAAGLIR